MSTTPSWTLTSSHAMATSGRFALTLDLANPQRPMLICDQSGLGRSDIAEPAKIEWHALALIPHPQHSFTIEEAYVRDHDLIVRYRQADDDVFAIQLNYRLLTDSVAGLGVELWISIQTDLLDTAPWLELCSRLDSAKWQVFQHEELLKASAGNTGDSEVPSSAREASATAGNGGKALPAGETSTNVAVLAASPSRAQTTCVLLIEPSDQGQFQLTSDPNAAEQHARLFGAFMEKGVIRRARLRLMMIDGTADLRQLSELYQDFACSPLPLTA